MWIMKFICIANYPGLHQQSIFLHHDNYCISCESRHVSSSIARAARQSRIQAVGLASEELAGLSGNSWFCRLADRLRIRHGSAKLCSAGYSALHID